MIEQPTKLLLIDDEPDILEFLSYNFRKRNFEVITGHNGLDGLGKAIENNPDIIITDILMPNMDGIEFCKEIRKLSNFNKTPIIYLTALNDDYKVLYAMSTGANQYVSKPISFEYLYLIVNRVLQESKQNQELKSSQS